MTSSPTPTDNWQEDILNQLNSIPFLTDADDLAHYGQDWCKQFEPNPSLIALPKSEQDVIDLVNYAQQHNIGIVPSGGRTGLSGGATATNGELVISFDKMNQILNYDEANSCIECQPGVTTEQIQSFAEEKGLYYPVDFASAGSSQIGGNIATNAGGIKVIRYGMTRNWVSGLKVVTGTGELLNLNQGLHKNATGYDLRHLIIGSEGTLGLITSAKIQLTRQAKFNQVMLLGVENTEHLMPILATFKKQLELSAFEFFSDAACTLVCEHHGFNQPLSETASYYALIEYETDSEEPDETALELFEQCLEQGWVTDGVISQSISQAEALWQLRERISETIAPFTPYKNDISVTPSKVPEFLAEIDRIVASAYPDFKLIWFGHIGDGNLHLNILKPENLDKADFIKQCEQVNPDIFACVQNNEGSISAEHGVGLLKKPYLNYSRSAEEIAIFKAIKQAFDPKGILNPGKLFN